MLLVSTTLASLSDRELVEANTQSGEITATLPPVDEVPEGSVVFFRRSDGANSFIVRAHAAELIDGQNYFELVLNGQLVQLRSSGSDWAVVGEAGTMEEVLWPDGTGYRKWANGALECWGTGSGKAISKQGKGEIYVSDERVDFQIPFSEPPYDVCHFVRSTSRWSNVRAVTETYLVARHYSSILDNNNAVTVWRAKGRWF